jgi:DNA-binding transcriptional LysR family regulator
VPNQFDLNLLTVLHVLFEERSVTLAGARLGRTQSAVSNSLNRLRQKFSDPLFVRTKDGFEPTPFAEQLRKPVSEIIRATESILLERADFDPKSADMVFRIAAPERLSLPVFLPLLKFLNTEAPGISVDIHSSDRDQAIALLASDRIDLALGWFDHPPTHLSSAFMFQENLVCLMSRNHPLLARAETPDIKDILSFPHLVVSSAGDRKAAFDVILARKGLKRQTNVSVSSFSLVPALLEDSDMIGVFTTSVSTVLQRQANLALLDVPLDLINLDHYLVWNRRHDRDLAHIWIREAVQAGVQETVLSE